MSSESEQNIFAPGMASLMVKLAEARWIERSISTPTRVAVDWTESGLQKAISLNKLPYLDPEVSESELGALSLEEHLCLNYLIYASGGRI